MIKVIREAKTAAEERDFVAKECADIRTSFRKEETDLRARNICKLIYVNLLGYATHFAQMDCMKLIVSNSYSDKRVGYLGLMMLLDERQEVLMLVTNSLKKDLYHVNQYVVGLALAAIGNIASAELARDCAPEVEKLLDASNPYIRKKAALAAIRIIRKVPDLIETFAPKVKGLLMEKNHGVLVTGIALMREMVTRDEKVRDEMRKFVPHLVRIFSSLLQYGFSPEYDVGGVTDPFLQVKILRLMRVLGEGNVEASDSMNVVLAGVATNTDNVRNVGNAILYECVNTIMGIESEAGLRVLAINTLAKFLAHRDNNIRYVALATLCTVVNIDMDAVQRHRNTIVDCLKDIDISIRRRALELVYALVNSQNVRILVRELINFLSIADIEFRADLTARLCIVAEKYSPTPRWLIDTILRVMAIAGDFVPESTSHSLLALISQNPDIQSYAVQRMYIALSSDLGASQSLAKTAVWTIGEFGDLLFEISPNNQKSSQPISSTSSLLDDLIPQLSTSSQTNSAVTSTVIVHHESEDDGLSPSSASAVSLSITPADVVTLFRALLSNVTTHITTKHQILTAALKLTSRLPSASQADFQLLIAQFETHINVELQQRATEYEKILEIPQLPNKLLMRIPAPEVKAMLDATVASSQEVKKHARAHGSNGTAQPASSGNAASRATSSQTSIGQLAATTQPDLLGIDLLDLNGGGATGMTAAPLPLSQVSNAPVDLLSFLGSGIGTPSPVLGGVTATSPSPQPTQAMQTFSSPSPVPLMDILGSGANGAASPTSHKLVALKSAKDGVEVHFELSKPQPSAPQFTLVTATFMNAGPQTITDLELKLSLPKYLKLQLMPLSSTSLAPFNGTAQQQIKLANTAQGQKPLMMRLRLEYKVNGESKAELSEPEIPSSF
jgi:AP-1 complex subunit gamma-1